MSRSDVAAVAADNPASRKLSTPIEAALTELIGVVLEAVGTHDPHLVEALGGVRGAVTAEWPTWPHGQPMSAAPRDGFAFLATGTHTHSPPDAQRGVKAGDRWWGIVLFDIWQEPHRFVFAKDGAELWSEPELWCALPDLLPGDPAPFAAGASSSWSAGTTKALAAATLALRSYELGNASPDLAREIADHCDAVLAEARP